MLSYNIQCSVSVLVLIKILFFPIINKSFAVIFRKILQFFVLTNERITSVRGNSYLGKQTPPCDIWIL